MKIKKILTMGILCSMLVSSVKVNAKSLEESFSGDSTYDCVNYEANIDVATYKKTTYAKTEGYYKRHYVRAYIGGSNNSASGANADSGRKWSSGNVKATASMKKKIKGSDAVAVRFSFPIGYAKYGQ